MRTFHRGAKPITLLAALGIATGCGDDGGAGDGDGSTDTASDGTGDGGTADTGDDGSTGTGSGSSGTDGGSTDGTGTGGTGTDTGGTTVDDTPPVPGDGGSLAVAPGSATAVVSWAAATDDQTPQDQLEYRVYTSNASDLTTVDDIESMGTPAGPYTSSITNMTVTDLPIESTVYFNVIVRDQADNRAAYTMAEAITVEPFARIDDINEGSDGSDPLALIVFDGKLYFSATTADEGRELWSYDGSSAPSIVVPLVAGTTGSSPSFPAVFDGDLYFRADGGSDGNEVWTYDGTPSPTVGNQIAQLHDINGSGNGNPEDLTVAGGTLYFIANDGTNGVELWQYTGTGDPTMVHDLLGDGCGVATCSGASGNLMAFDGNIYFEGDDGTTGDELWVYTGSDSPTLVHDINDGDCSGDPCDSNARPLAVYDGALYFAANDGDTGTELWQYTGSGTPSRVADIRPDGGSGPMHGAVYDGKLYFSAADGSVNRELWVYDGTGDPTMVADLSTGSSDPIDLTVYDGKLYFAATGSSVGTELWVYDGTGDPTPVWDAVAGSSAGADPRHMTVYDGRMYFAADMQDGAGRELYVYIP